MAETTKKHKGSQAKKWKRAPRGGGVKACQIEGCKRPYRAKGYCFFHYRTWRKGDLPGSRYKTCFTEKCLKRQFKAGLCQAHHDERFGKKVAAAST